MITGSLSLLTIVENQVITCSNFIFNFHLLSFFLLIGFSETNRIPFDISEAEAEVIAGYNIEYGAIFFLAFFLSEYLNMLLFSYLTIFIFFGSSISVGSYKFFISFYSIIKIVVVLYFFSWVRATEVRVRYDQIIIIFWKILLPIYSILFICYIPILYLMSNIFIM